MTQEELNKVSGLLHYLNSSFGHVLDVEVTITDSNGETVGHVEFNGEQYLFSPGEAPV